jgi:gamma-glutamyl hercynylcysteine S-oxide hydrolase
MCRHLGYLGEPRSLHDLLYAPPHSLEKQSYAPRRSAYCTLNADGFGAGWYAGSEAVRFRRSQPMWTDLSFADVARVCASNCVVAAVRSATPGFPVEESCAQPFRVGSYLFSHNGRIEDFVAVEPKLGELAGDLAPTPDARAPVDSALLFAMAAAAWRAGQSLGEGLASVVIAAAGLSSGRYNLLAADGRSLAATRYGDTLFIRREGGLVIASEPYDDEPGWEEVPDRSLVIADDSGFQIHSL